MAMDTKEITKITFNLVVIYLVGGLLLAGVYGWAAPKIFKINKEHKEEALKAMVPAATNAPALIGEWKPWDKHAEYYRANSGEVIVDYIVEGYGKGYSSYIQILTAVTPDFKVDKIEILHHGETPGLGDEILMDWFKDQYVGKDYEHLEVIKGETPDKIQAITGATISTRAVTYAVRDAVGLLRNQYEGKEFKYTWEGK